MEGSKRSENRAKKKSRTAHKIRMQRSSVVFMAVLNIVIVVSPVSKAGEEKKNWVTHNATRINPLTPSHFAQTANQHRHSLKECY